MSELELVSLLSAVAMAWVAAGVSVSMARWAHRPRTLEVIAVVCWAIAAILIAAVLVLLLPLFLLPGWLAAVPFAIVAVLFILHRVFVGERRDASALIALQEDLQHGELSNAPNRKRLYRLQSKIQSLVAERRYEDATRLAREGSDLAKGTSSRIFGEWRDFVLALKVHKRDR